jgi:hypothetical protein
VKESSRALLLGAAPLKSAGQSGIEVCPEGTKTARYKHCLRDWRASLTKHYCLEAEECNF